MMQGFLPGNELVHVSSGRVLYIVEALLPRIQRVKVTDVLNRDERFIDEAELRLKVASGEIDVVRKGSSQTRALHARTVAEDQAHQRSLQFLHQLHQLQSKYGVSFSKAYSYWKQAHASGDQQLAAPMSLSQAFRLWERERNGTPLQLGNAAKGNRTPRYATEVYKVIEDLARAQLLMPRSRWTMRTLTELVNQQLHEMGLLPTSQNVSRDLVQRVIHERVHADPEHKRMPPREAIGAKAVAGGKIRIARPFERVEQDALHLPWLIRTPYGDSTNVWLVHAIDCCTSVPLGWCLVIGAPRTPDTLKCIETILFPKQRRYSDLGLSYDFDIYGTPAWLVFDNGSEVKSERIARLSRLSMTVHRLKANHPHEKPFIERLNGSLKSYLETLPGCTRFDGKDGKRDPLAARDPVMDLAEIERWIVRFYFEQWIHQPLGRLAESVFSEQGVMGSTPLERYRLLTEERGCPVPLPPSVDAWRSAVYEHHVRTLSRKTGISYRNYHFKGDRLQHLIAQFGETEVTVLIDPDDFRWVYVMDKNGRTLVPLVNSSADETTLAYSFDEADALLQSTKAPSHEAPVALRQDVLNRSLESGKKERWNRAGVSHKDTKSARSKATAERARLDAALKRAAANPMPPSLPALGHPPMGSDDDDWASAAPLQVHDRRTGEVRS